MKWPRRTRKSKRIRAAAEERKRSERLLAEAEAIAHDLHEIRKQNHFAEALRNLIEGDDE